MPTPEELRTAAKEIIRQAKIATNADELEIINLGIADDPDPDKNITGIVPKTPPKNQD